MRITDKAVAAFAAFLFSFWVCHATTPAQAAESLQPTANPDTADSVVISYDPADGNLQVKGNGVSLTTIELNSNSAIFDPTKIPDAAEFGPPFDVADVSKIFKLNTNGFEVLDLGPILGTGLTSEALVADLLVDGSILPRGKLTDTSGGGPFLYVAGTPIPEPSSLALFAVGMLLMTFRRVGRER